MRRAPLLCPVIALIAVEIAGSGDHQGLCSPTHLMHMACLQSLPLQSSKHLLHLSTPEVVVCAEADTAAWIAQQGDLQQDAISTDDPTTYPNFDFSEDQDYPPYCTQRPTKVSSSTFGHRHRTTFASLSAPETQASSVSPIHENLVGPSQDSSVLQSPEMLRMDTPALMDVESPPLGHVESPASDSADAQFDEVQRNIVALVVEGRESVNIVGFPGTGKSHSTRECVRQLRDLNKEVLYCTYMWKVAAMTGEGCVTFQNALASGLFDRPLTFYTRQSGAPYKILCGIINRFDTVVFEELPTFPVPLLVKAEKVFRECRATLNPAFAYQPWGGVQIVANGDINQSMQIRRAGDQSWAGLDGITYCWQLPEYPEWFNATCVLKQVYRSTDKDYCEFMQQVGAEDISEDNWAKLRARVGVPPPAVHKIYTFSRAEAHRLNVEYISSHPGGEVEFQSTKDYDRQADRKCGFQNIEEAFGRLQERLHANGTPQFVGKIGCEVTLLANVDPSNGLYQGLTGVVESFLSPSDAIPDSVVKFCDELTAPVTPLVKWDNGILHVASEHVFSEAIRDINGQIPAQACYAVYKLVPLRLARAATLTSCIGREDANVLLMLNSPHIYEGLSYIGLGRTTRGYDGVYLPKDFDERSLRMDPACVAKVKALQLQASTGSLQVIRHDESRPNRFAEMEASFCNIDEATVPNVTIADVDNPSVEIQPTKISLRFNRQWRTFKHAICQPGYIPSAPNMDVFYELRDLAGGDSINWWRDSVHYACAGTNKNAPQLQEIPLWGSKALMRRRNCAGSMMCEVADCQWSTTKRNRVGQCKRETGNNQECPVHHSAMESAKCDAVFQTYEEVDGARCGLLTASLTGATNHSHPPWSTAALMAASKKIIWDAVVANPDITYRKLVSGKALKDWAPSKGSLVSLDKAFANMNLVTKQMVRARTAVGHKAVEIGLVAAVQRAIHQLGEVSYILTSPDLARGLTPLIICATDKQLYFLCSHKHFTGQMVDFTFNEVQGHIDDWDWHSMDYDLGLVLNFVRVYASKKSAEATAFYLHHLLRECKLRGFNFEWGKSIVCLLMDFHYGQAVGILRHLIEVLGEDGKGMFLKLVGGCGTHLSHSLEKGIAGCSAEWASEALPDVGLTVSVGDKTEDLGSEFWMSLSPDHRKNKMCQRARSLTNTITGVHSLQSEVDFALHELSRMSATLKRITDWISQPVIKVLACPAYSQMELFVRQANAPEHDLSSEKFKLTDNPAEGAHNRRSSLAKQEEVDAAILTSYQSDHLDWERWLAAKRHESALNGRTADGMQQQKVYQAMYKANARSAVVSSCAERDGPQFNTKRCQACSGFMPSNAATCPSCRIPATRLGNASVNANIGVGELSGSTAHEATSNHQARAALEAALLATHPDREYVFAEVHEKRGKDKDTEWLVEWAGFPFKKDWDWKAESKLKDQNGKWKCSEAMERYASRMKSKPKK